MADPIAEWSFDAGTGATVADDSGGTSALTVGSGSYAASGHTGAGFQNTTTGTGASGSVPVVSGTTCTVMAWVKPTALPAGGTQLILGSLDSGGTDFALWAQRSAIGSPNVLQGNARLGGGVVPVNGVALTVGQWSHVAMTYDGSTLKLFKDGALVGSVSNTNTINNRTAFAVAGLSGSGTSDLEVDDGRYFSTDESANIATWMNTPVPQLGGPTIVTGTGSASFGALGSDAGGVRATAGTGALNGGALAGAAVGVVADNGVGLGNFGGLGAVVTGVRATTAAVSTTFGGLGAAVEGTRTTDGSATFTGGTLAGQGTGVTGPPITELHHPSGSLVMVAWLRQVVGLAAAMTLPEPRGWFTTGFATVTPVGGNPGVYLPERAPVFQVDCWAVNPAAAGAVSVSRKIPRAEANELADRVVMSGYVLSPPEVTLPAQYLPVWIESVIAISEVREVPEPDNSYAHYSVDVQLRWVERAPAVNL